MNDPVRAIAYAIGQRCRPWAVASLRQGESMGWSSLLFDGGRHRIELDLRGSDADDAVEHLHRLCETDLVIPGHIVTEIGMVGIGRCADGPIVTFEAVTVVR